MKRFFRTPYWLHYWLCLLMNRDVLYMINNGYTMEDVDYYIQFLYIRRYGH